MLKCILKFSNLISDDKIARDINDKVISNNLDLDCLKTEENDIFQRNLRKTYFSISFLIFSSITFTLCLNLKFNRKLNIKHKRIGLILFASNLFITFNIGCYLLLDDLFNKEYKRT